MWGYVCIYHNEHNKLIADDTPLLANICITGIEIGL